MIAPPKPPSRDELEALIKEARARQLRRRLIAASGIAVVAAVGLSAYALVGEGRSSSTLGSPPISAAPLCRASQLATAIVFGAATGSALGGATITNHGGSTCSLPGGRPDVVITAAGKRLAVDERVPPFHFPGPPARVLAPDAKAVVWMQWFNWCGKSPTPVRFSLRFHGLQLSANAQAGPRCDSAHYASGIFVSLPRRLQ